MSPAEVADLSDRLLADGSRAFNDQQTMARLELVILKTLKAPDKTYRPVLWRNLGIIHYHQQKYKQARARSAVRQRTQPQERPHPFLPGLPVRPQGQDLRKIGQDHAPPGSSISGRPSK